jgi:hypothetical protein
MHWMMWRAISVWPYNPVFKMDGEDRSKDIVFQMESCPFPIIGAINGWAINAGGDQGLTLIRFPAQSERFLSRTDWHLPTNFTKSAYVEPTSGRV